jgi:competence protein ComEC
LRQKVSFLLLSVVILAFITLYHSITISDKKFHLIFCDVGQGDGIFIRTPDGHDIVIDGGPGDFSMTDCLSRHMPFWDRDLDAVYLTHPDADHLTGLIEVVKTYNIKYFGTSNAPKDTEVYKELIKNISDKKLEIHYLRRGDRVVTNDGMRMQILWPSKEFANSKSLETNDYSLVHLLEFGDFRAVLTGDVPSIYLNSLMPLIGRIDVFKPPHHGSRTGIDAFTFQHTVPKYAVLSFGAKNRYGHPNIEVLNLIKEAKIPYLSTIDGDVEIVSDGKKWWIK